MNHALERVRKITEELKDIQAELFESGASGEAQSPEFLDDAACMEVLSAFKATVDDLRRLLFFYVNNLTLQMGVDPTKTMHSYRLRRAAELLDVLSRPPILVLSGDEEVLLAKSLNKFLRTYKDHNPGLGT
jgi:hypothetical protein